jgi:hypothetical protein
MVREVSLSKEISDAETVEFLETALKKAPKRLKVQELEPAANQQDDEFDISGAAKTAVA